jgi:hypothetical protein
MATFNENLSYDSTTIRLYYYQLQIRRKCEEKSCSVVQVLKDRRIDASLFSASILTGTLVVGQ